MGTLLGIKLSFYVGFVVVVLVGDCIGRVGSLVGLSIGGNGWRVGLQGTGAGEAVGTGVGAEVG